MPPTNVTAGDICSIWARCLINGQEDLFTTHWRVRDGADPIEISNWFGALDNALSAAGALPDTYAQCLSNEVLGISWYAQVIYPVRYLRSQLPSIPEGAGEVNSPALPQNVSVAITLQAIDAVPRGRGTKHIGGVPTSFVASGMVTNVGNAAYLLLADQLLNPISIGVGGLSQILDPIVYHRAVPSLSLIPIRRVVQQTSRIMRRRTVGLGS